MLYVIESSKPLGRVVEDLQVAVARHKFGVLGVHDLKAKMAEKGVAFARECRIFEVCQPAPGEEGPGGQPGDLDGPPVPDLGLRGGRDHEAGHDQADGPDRAVRDPRSQGGRRGRGDDARAHHGGGRPIKGSEVGPRTREGGA